MSRLIQYRTLPLLLLFGILTYSCDLFNLPGSGDQDVLFVKYYGGEGDHECVQMLPVDNGYVLAGNATLNGRQQVYLVRTNKLGELVWERKYGEANKFYKTAAISILGNSIAVGGSVIEDGAESPFVLVVDAQMPDEGAPFVQPLISAPGDSTSLQDLSYTETGDLVVVGATSMVDTLKVDFNAETDSRDFWVSCLDSTLAVKWTSVFGYGEREVADDVLVRNGLVYVVGSSSVLTSSGLSPSNLVLLRYDLAGNVLQAIPEGSLSLDIPGSLLTYDGGFLMVANEIQGGESVGSIFQLDHNFLTVSKSEITPASNDTYQAIRLRRNTNALDSVWLAGSTINESGEADFLIRKLVKRDAGWEVVVDATLGFVSESFAVDIALDSDGRPLIAGTHEFGPGNKLFCLIKTDPFGELKVD